MKIENSPIFPASGTGGIFRSRLRNVGVTMINSTFFNLSFVVRSACWKPKKASVDHDLGNRLLTASDFYKCEARTVTNWRKT